MKKIAWIKYTGSVEIGHHLLFTTGNTDLRTEFFKAFKKNGVEVQVYGGLSKDTKEYLETEKGKREHSNISVTKKTTIDKDVDFVVLENGTDNARFEIGIDGERVPQIAYANRLISGYKGVVFYLQTDPALPFTFFPEYLSNEYNSKWLGWGNFASLVKDKKFVVLMNAKRIQNLVDLHQQCARTRYVDVQNNGAAFFEYFDVHYCGIYSHDNLDIKNPGEYEAKISYVGGERNRIKKMKRLYFDVAEMFGVEIWGKWEDVTKEKFPEVSWGGVLGRGLTKEVYNSSFATVVLGDQNYEKVGMVSGRFFEAISSNTLSLIDSDLRDTLVSDILDKHLLDQLVVSTTEDVQQKIAQLYDSEERTDLIKEASRQMFLKSPQDSYDWLIKIFDKYKDFEEDDESTIGAIGCFGNLLQEREEKGVYSKMAYDLFLEKIYKQNNKTKEFFDGDLSIDNFLLKDTKNFVNLQYDKSTRCMSCGNLLPKKDHKFVSKTKCAECLDKNDQGQKERMFFNLKEFSKTIG